MKWKDGFCKSFLFPGDEDDSTDSTFDESLYLEALGSRPPLPDVNYDNSYLPVLELLTMCTDEDPTKRPSAKEIVDMLSLEAK